MSHSVAEVRNVIQFRPLHTETAPIKIIRSQWLRGCNIYHDNRVIRLQVDLEGLAGRSTRLLGADFLERFRACFLTRNKLLFGRDVDMDFVERLSFHGGVPIEEALLHAILSVDKTILATMHYLDRIEYTRSCLERFGIRHF